MYNQARYFPFICFYSSLSCSLLSSILLAKLGLAIPERQELDRINRPRVGPTHKALITSINRLKTGTNYILVIINPIRIHSLVQSDFWKLLSSPSSSSMQNSLAAFEAIFGVNSTAFYILVVIDGICN